MRQLDLFGSFFDTPAKEKQEEKQAFTKKEEEKASAVIKPEEISYSSLEVAEEALQEAPAAGLDEIIITDEAEQKQTDQETDFSLAANDTSKQINAGHTVIDKLEIVSVTSSPLNNTENDTKADDKKQTEGRIPGERNGLIIFEDGKITVKVKNKPAANTSASSAESGSSPAESSLPPAKSDRVLPATDKPIGANVAEKEEKPLQKRGRKSLQEIEAEADLVEVPDDEILFQKQYYPISQVAKWFRVNTSLLRFWENEFEILKPKKNRKGDRLFRPEDVKNLQLIYQLLRQRKYTIEGAKEYIKTNRKKADTELQLTNALQKLKSFLLDLRSNLQS